MPDHVLAAEAITSASDGHLVLAAVLGIAAVILLIAWAKWHPFLALIVGAAVLGLTAGAAAGDTVDSFTAGVGSTVGSVGLLIALGSMIGALLSESGGADGIVGTIVRRFSGNALPWALAGVAALIGLPLFFEVGVVLLVPIVLLVAQRTGMNLLKIGIPALAGLSVLHGLVPPHPGPLVAVSSLGADLGLTLAFGLICAIPTVIIAGPVFGNFITRYVHVPVPARVADPVDTVKEEGVAEPARRRTPSFWAAVGTVLLPIVLMLLRAIAELTMDEGTRVRTIFEILGEPVVALLLGLLLAMVTLGRGAGFNRSETSAVIGGSLPPIAGILLIVAAGGGFKQVLVDAGVGNVVANAAESANISALLLGWLVAVGIRIATGSATVATITAAGIVAPLAQTLDKPEVALLALAIGCGSLFFSHVNDAGFWLVKEYFGMTVGQTIKTWSVMETIISVVGFVFVLLLNLIV
ncbi:GntT/GntP/DsdX family permease [Symbioplanes lichenis]|uniref:GntT/GntP/DsdX family permease n=1 Tax=Symbioplanes lichenis TaxID=1629072 RepID=UPI00273A3C95|nr:gluconate:H+ symporter [Actinoplanes lichenis]